MLPGFGRRNFKIWEEGTPPQVVFEFTTEDSRARDLSKKKRLYRRLGVREYYVFDPEGGFMEPRFRAFRLEKGRYLEIRAGETVYSPGLELDVVVRGQLLDFRDPTTGEVLPTPDDVAELAAEVAHTRAALKREQAARARDRDLAEARVRELQAEVERLKRGQKPEDR